jgi:hypothetical protein
VLPRLVVLYLTGKPSHVGVDVDGLACSLHRPVTCSSQRGGLCCLIDVVQFHCSVVGGGPFQGCEAPRSGYLMWC